LSCLWQTYQYKSWFFSPFEEDNNFFSVIKVSIGFYGIAFRPFNDEDTWSEFEKLFNIAKTNESLLSCLILFSSIKSFPWLIMIWVYWPATWPIWFLPLVLKDGMNIFTWMSVSLDLLPITLDPGFYEPLVTIVNQHVTIGEIPISLWLYSRSSSPPSRLWFSRADDRQWRENLHWRSYIIGRSVQDGPHGLNRMYGSQTMMYFNRPAPQFEDWVAADPRNAMEPRKM